MRIVVFTIKDDLGLSEKEIMEELLQTETRMNSESKLKFHLSQETPMIDELEKKIDAYKVICKLAGVPKFIIQDPRVAIPPSFTGEDLRWTKKSMLVYAESK